MKIAVIGGGLAGMTAAAYLSESKQMEGILFERSPQLGGRAFTYEMNGFTLNYGAHAIYGLERHDLTQIVNELKLSFKAKEVDKDKIMYAKNGKQAIAPLDYANLVNTDLLTTMEKVRFAGEITTIISQIDQLKDFATLDDYLNHSNADDEMKELWEHLVCSNFFISPEDARKVSGAVISEYYNNLFLSKRPVNYVLGSWAAVTKQLTSMIEASNRFQIKLQESVEQIQRKGDRFLLKSKYNEYVFDKVIFAMPVQQVFKLLRNTEWETYLHKYENSSPTEVMVFDIGLKEVVARPFSYISDLDNKMFISDISATDTTLVPEGGQLLQGIVYISDHFERDEERRIYLDTKRQQMESLFDRYYPGWREVALVQRVSKKVMVASVKNTTDNELLPVTIPPVPFYFCGDGCIGKGELAERSFSSARTVAKMLINEIDR